MASDHIEVARAFVTIVPSLQGSQATISKELGAVTEPAAKEVGEKSGKNFGESLAKGLKTTGAVIAGAMAAATAGAVAAGKAFVDSAKNVAAYGDNIDKMSQKMGISAKAYQEWDFIMQHAGASIDSLKTSMKTLATAAVNGSDAFTTLGISQEQLASMSQEEIFNATISALQNVEDETQRTALASKLLGRGATELGALFNMSADETEALRQQVHDLGGVMSDEAVKDAATFQDEMQNMNTAMDGMKRNMMSNFLPGMSDAMKGLSKVFSGDKSGIGEIRSGLESVITNVTALAPEFFALAETLIMSLIEGFGPMLPSLTSTIFNVLIQAITTLTTMAPQMMPSIILGIQGIMKALMQAMPVILSGLTELIMSLVTWLSSDGVVQDFVSGIVQLTSQLVNSFAMILPVLLPAIVKIIMEVCKALTEPSNVKLLLDAVLTLVGAIFMALVNCVPELIEGVKGVLLNLGNLVGDFLFWIVPKVAGGLTNVINTVKRWGENIKGFFTGLWDNLKEGVTKGLDNIKSKFTSIFDKVRDTVKTAIDKIKSFFKFNWSLPKLKMPHFSISGSFSLNPPSIPKFSVSWYAKAMNEPVILNDATIFGASNGRLLGGGEAGSEVIVGTDKLMSMMRDAVGLAGQPITINVYGAEGQNVNDLAEKIAEKLDAMTKRKGVVYA